jgi:hypothetical protein
MPANRPEPIDVATVFKTFGPGMRTFSIKKPSAGKNAVNNAIYSFMMIYIKNILHNYTDFL